MTEGSKPKKKVVHAGQPDATGPGAASNPPAWTPSPEAKGRADRLRIFAWILWLAAIGIEIFAIFWVLRQDPVSTWLLIGCILVAGALAIPGSLLWKQANRLDPASEKDQARFFVQNQLGAIMTVIAFLPLIVMIFLNRDMDGRQKAIVGSVGIAVLAIATLLGISWDSPSQERYAHETAIVTELTGQDNVYWTKSGKVFHLCSDVPDVNRESKDGNIYEGTVADAHGSGKSRLTQRWESEARVCGYTPAQIEAARGAMETASSDD